MSIPTLVSLSPNTGRALGDTYVTVIGTNFLPPVENPTGSTVVLFNGTPAGEIGIVSATEIRCLSPQGDPDASCTVTVQNVVQNTPPTPPTITSGANSLPFTYTRPNLSTPADRSNHGVVALINTKLISDLKKFVIKEAHHDQHVDYADATDAAIPETHQAENPHLKLLGPAIDEDPFYRQVAVGRLEVIDTIDPAKVHIFDQVQPSKLTYTYIGVARTSSEAGNLFEAMARYIRATQQLSMVVGSQTFVFELSAIWEERADFSKGAKKHGIYQFTGRLIVRGVFLGGDRPEDKIGETRIVANEVTLGIVQKRT